MGRIGTTQLIEDPKGTDRVPVGRAGNTLARTVSLDQIKTHALADVVATIGLGNVTNTSDMDKPVSTAQQEAIDAVNASTVHIEGEETVTGVKRFSTSPIAPSDIRYYMDGQNGRPTLDAWQASPTTVEVTSVFQAAITNNLVVKVPEGDFVVDALTLRSNLIIQGEGAGKSRIRRKAGSANSIFNYVGDASTRITNLTIDYVTIDGGNKAAGGAGVYVDYFGRAYTAPGETISQGICSLNGCEVKNFTYGIYLQHGDSFYLNQCDIHDCQSKGVMIANSANMVNLHSCTVHHNDHEGVYIGLVSSNCTLSNCFINDNGDYGVHLYVCEQPSILYCAFQRNGQQTDGNGNYYAGKNALYAEGYVGGDSSVFLVESLTVEGCLFGANAGLGYDMALTYVESAKISGNYWYNIAEGKQAFIRLSTHCLGIDISGGNRWKAYNGSGGGVAVSVPPHISAASDAVYTLDDSGDTSTPKVSVVTPTASASLSPTQLSVGSKSLRSDVGYVSPSSAVSVSAGALDLSAFASDVAHVSILGQDVTSILFPASPVDGQSLRIRFKQASSGGPYNVSGWPAAVVFTGGTFSKNSIANSQDVISFVYSASQSEWLEVSRTVNATDYLQSLIGSGSGQGLTTSTTKNVASLSLPPGEWDVEGNVNFGANSATISISSAGISATSATLPSDGTEVFSGVQTTTLTNSNSIVLPRKRFTLTATTTVYLLGRAAFSSGSVAVYGSMSARRVR